MLLPVLRGALNLLRLPFLPLWWLGRRVGRPRAAWIAVRVGPRVVELDPPRSALMRWVPMLARVLPTSLSRLRRLAHHVAHDDGVKGIVLTVPPLLTGWATARGLREILLGLRAAGKQVVVHLPRGGGNREIYVATAADRVIVSPQGTLIALGLSIESRYLRPLLDKLGVGVEAYGRGEYKTAAEPMVRESMSEPQREQLTALLETIDRELVAAIASRRGGDEDEARSFLARGILRGEQAVAAGIADEVAYEDELPARLGCGPKERPAAGARYLAYKEARFFGPLRRRPYVAVVEIKGVIADQSPGLGGRGAFLEPVVAALRTARADPRAVGVVLHVDSPGGSATASDLIHREIVRLREKKPVVAYFGEVAASGGYYVGAPASAIVAQPTTITGSIGVISAKVVARQLLDMVGVRTETLRMSPHADMFSPNRELAPEERELLAREIDGFYDAFVAVVAAGRGKSVEEVDELARGRVWSGRDARDRGLVDRLGGFDAALDEVRGRIEGSESFRRGLRPVVVHPRRLDVPPAEPAEQAAAAALAGVRRLSPELADLAALVGGGERVLFYAHGVPTVE